MRENADLVESLVLYSGLPEDYARRRLHALIADHGFNVDTITLGEIRELAAALLQEVILNLNNEEC